jgi:hypothetical protein
MDESYSALDQSHSTVDESNSALDQPDVSANQCRLAAPAECSGGRHSQAPATGAAGPSSAAKSNAAYAWRAASGDPAGKSNASARWNVAASDWNAALIPMRSNRKPADQCGNAGGNHAKNRGGESWVLDNLLRGYPIMAKFSGSGFHLASRSALFNVRHACRSVRHLC